MKKNILQKKDFDKLAGETMGNDIRRLSNLDTNEANAMAEVNRAIERSKRDAQKRRAE